MEGHQTYPHKKFHAVLYIFVVVNYPKRTRYSFIVAAINIKSDLFATLSQKEMMLSITNSVLTLNVNLIHNWFNIDHKHTSGKLDDIRLNCDVFSRLCQTFCWPFELFCMIYSCLNLHITLLIGNLCPPMS